VNRPNKTNEEIFYDEIRSLVKNLFVDNKNFSSAYYLDKTSSELKSDVMSNGKLVLEKIEGLKHLLDIEELSLEELGLNEDEIDFVKRVYVSPGCKLDSTSKWIDDGTEHGASHFLWKKPEELGLIEAVGSYKWVPCKKLEMRMYAKKDQ
jgi:hypothetical protein